MGAHGLCVCWGFGCLCGVRGGIVGLLLLLVGLLPILRLGVCPCGLLGRRLRLRLLLGLRCLLPGRLRWLRLVRVLRRFGPSLVCGPLGGCVRRRRRRPGRIFGCLGRTRLLGLWRLSRLSWGVWRLWGPCPAGRWGVRLRRRRFFACRPGGRAGRFRRLCRVGGAGPRPPRRAGGRSRRPPVPPVPRLDASGRLSPVGGGGGPPGLPPGGGPSLLATPSGCRARQVHTDPSRRRSTRPQPCPARRSRYAVPQRDTNFPVSGKSRSYREPPLWMELPPTDRWG